MRIEGRKAAFDRLRKLVGGKSQIETLHNAANIIESMIMAMKTSTQATNCMIV